MTAYICCMKKMKDFAKQYILSGHKFKLKGVYFAEKSYDVISVSNLSEQLNVDDLGLFCIQEY